MGSGYISLPYNMAAIGWPSLAATALFLDSRSALFTPPSLGLMVPSHMNSGVLCVSVLIFLNHAYTLVNSFFTKLPYYLFRKHYNVSFCDSTDDSGFKCCQPDPSIIKFPTDVHLMIFTSFDDCC